MISRHVGMLALVYCISFPALAQDGYVSRSLVDETVVGPNGAVTVADALRVNELLGAQEKVVAELTDGVYHIRGWGIAHTIAIDAPEGWIIVDTGDSVRTATEMRHRLEEKVGRKIEVAAILYTHSHYTDGTGAWLDEGAEIWGHEHLDRHKRADAGVSILSGNFGVRALIQFGVLHPTTGPDAFPNALGFGPEKLVGERAYRPPTRTFADGQVLELEIAGEPVEVAPNRTDVLDSVGFWFPNRSTLVTNAVGSASIFNLYSLRGDRYREPLEYMEAGEWALSKNAEVLADIHGPGVVGKEAVREAIEVPRDQIQLIHDQAVRMIAQGMDARRAAENVYMPRHLREGWETYGQVESHVKQVYHGRLGWMGNDVYDINPLSVRVESTRTVELMGGAGRVREAAAAATAEGGFENWSWALRLTSLLLELDPADAEARSIRAKAARALGRRTSSANARGWYITEALAMENALQLGDTLITLEAARTLLGTPSIDALMESPLEDSFQYLRYLVDPCKSEARRLAFTVSVEGSDSIKRIVLRNGVVVLSDSADKAENHIDVSRRAWSEFVIGDRSFAGENEVVGRFESVLARPAVPRAAVVLDARLDEIVENVNYTCDGGESR